MRARPDEPAVLRRLVQLLVGPPPPADEVGRLAEDAVVRAAYFLLAVGPHADVEAFITGDVPGLLRQLSRDTERRWSECNGQPRGRIHWPQTAKSRLSRGDDPCCFVCPEARHEYDNPENQLLVYLLDRIESALRSLPTAVATGTCLAVEPGERRLAPTSARVEGMARALQNHRRDGRLRCVSLPGRITEIHLYRAGTQKIRGYCALVPLYEHYRRTVVFASWERVAEIGARSLVLPGAPGAEAEPWLRLATAIIRQCHP